MKKFRIGVAVIQDRQGRYLIAQRPKGKHLAGLWEFPGGKCHVGEPVERCIRRECLEELGIEVKVGIKMMGLAYQYPDRSLTLHFYHCRIVSGVPRSLERQQIKWVSLRGLSRYPHPEANLVLIKRLHLKRVGK